MCVNVLKIKYLSSDPVKKRANLDIAGTIPDFGKKIVTKCEKPDLDNKPEAPLLLGSGRVTSSLWQVPVKNKNSIII